MTYNKTMSLMRKSPGQIEKECPICHRKFFTWAHQPKINYGIHCSRKCAAMGKPVTQRFWEKVQKTDNCWLWMGSTNFSGYGQFWPNGVKCSLMVAHRFSWELHNGKIPDGLFVLH